ncbi:LCP family glycopolymer transferase [Mycolicibacterium mengxianglii]|uniref:LCP family glycopolymer transferase n=1 Tax=Mycolicibacterium mengxianglii TaxID=2736649 RepID=UPI0018D0C00B|nr:LCP family protein [Mycolicibacterium mengxianglii]
MSDGDSATPGQHGSSDPDGDNQWLTRSARPAPGAAPWERALDAGADSDEPVAAEADLEQDPDFELDPDFDDGEPEGNHTAGVTVADLFAKLTGDVPESLQRSRSSRARQPEPEEVAADPEVPVVGPGDPPTITMSAYASEIPDLGALARRSAGTNRVHPEVAEEETTVLPAVIDDEPPAGPVAPAGPGRRSALLAGRLVAALVAVLALVLTGGAWQWNSTKNGNLNNVAALDPDSRDILDPNAQFGDENFLIVGTDSRYGQNSNMGAGDTDDAGGTRSDTVMLVNIPASRDRVVAVSFPRDLAITPMECEPWNPETGEYGPIYDETSGTWGPDKWYTESKLNSAYSYGGPKCLVKVIQKISGLSINRFMAIDFAGFSKMVDALGGVEVCSTTPLEDYELGTVLASAGRQMVDGHTALNYVRARQVTTEFNGDYGRIKRQQLFLSSLLRSLISKETFFSLSKLNNVVNMFINDSYVDNIGTKDLVDLGQSLQGVAAGRITFITVPTTGYADEYGNEQPRTDDIHALFSAIINDDPLPGENNQNETTVPVTTSQTETSTTTTTTTEAPTEPSTQLVDAMTVDPSEVSVHVANSTGQTGLGSTASSAFGEYGFAVDTPDDYSTQLEQTTVMYSMGNEQAAATVASALGVPAVEEKAGLGDTVQVVLGSDFSTVNHPEASGSRVSMEVLRGDGSSTPTELPEDLTVTNGADTSCE